MLFLFLFTLSVDGNNLWVTWFLQKTVQLLIWKISVQIWHLIHKCMLFHGSSLMRVMNAPWSLKMKLPCSKAPLWTIYKVRVTASWEQWTLSQTLTLWSLLIGTEMSKCLVDLVNRIPGPMICYAQVSNLHSPWKTEKCGTISFQCSRVEGWV